MSAKTWIIFAVLCLGLIGGLVFLNQSQKVDVGDIDVTKLQPASSDNGNIADHVSGPEAAKVTIIEYGDFQCPGCASAAPILKSVTAKYKDELKLVFRNYPLTSIHPNARAAAAAAEAAGLQGKYWPMHDQLYSTQNSWSQLGSEERTKAFRTYAEALGIDADKWQEDLTSERVAAKIDYDTALGRKLAISGTPAIYVNGKFVDQYVKDGKLVSKDVAGSQPVWGDPEAFDKLILMPAFKDAGVKVDK